MDITKRTVPLSVPRNRKEEILLFVFRSRYSVVQLIGFMNRYFGFQFHLKTNDLSEVNAYTGEKLNECVEERKKKLGSCLFYRALDPTEKVLHYLLPYHKDFGFSIPLQTGNTIYDPNPDPLFLFEETPLWFWFIYNEKGEFTYQKEYWEYVKEEYWEYIQKYLHKDFYKKIDFSRLGKAQQGIFFRCMC